METLITGIKNVTRAILQRDRFKEEEVPSDCGYFSGYTEPVKITHQIDILRSHWPSLKPDPALRYHRDIYQTLQHPRLVEGPFALIRPGFFSDKYDEELYEVLKAINKDRKGEFSNWREGCLDERYLRQTNHTFAKMRQLVERQPDSDILIVGEQFGIRHRGRSVRRTREVFIAGEYGEGAKNVGTMILTNPIRLKHHKDLKLNCPGDVCSLDANGIFSLAPVFFFDGGGVGFNAYWIGNTYENFGSVSGIVS